MKRLKPNKDTVLQYYYDYGLEKTCQLLHLSNEEFNNIISPPINKNVDINKHLYLNIKEVDEDVAKVIADNYDYLRDKYVKNTSSLKLSQSDEDIFHNALLQIISDGVKDNILAHIDQRIKMIRFHLVMDNKKVKNALLKETTKNNLDFNQTGIEE